MNAAKSWDHRVILLPPRRLDQAQSCSARCPSPVTHMTSYRYVTGRYGRTTTARRQVCTDHAARFAARHGVAMPTEPSSVEPRLLDQVVGAAVAAGAWPMWAQRRSDLPDGRQFLNVVDNRRTAEMYGGPVVPVQVVEDADGTYWGWVYNDDEPDTNRRPRGGVPQMIQPTEGMFSMQFPYGPKAEQDRGRGRTIRLSVHEQACERCPTAGWAVCCSSHGKLLCHRCYRQTHFVEVCVEGCTACQTEGLPVVMT